MSSTELLIRKLAVAFGTAFIATLITSLEGLSKQPDFGWNKSLLIALVAGALGAGVRAVLAFGPVNLVPTDAQHSLLKPAAKKKPAKHG